MYMVVQKTDTYLCSHLEHMRQDTANMDCVNLFNSGMEQNKTG